MWSNFFVQQDEEGRTGVAGQSGGLAGMKGGRGQRRIHKLSDSQEGKIKLAFFVSIVGVTLTVLGMGTEFWVELAQPKNFSGNQTCQLAHYGLWKGCIRTLRVDEIDPERTSCGPADLPGGETSEWCVSVWICVNLFDLHKMSWWVSAGTILCLTPCLLSLQVWIEAATMLQYVYRYQSGLTARGQRLFVERSCWHHP